MSEEKRENDDICIKGLSIYIHINKYMNNIHSRTPRKKRLRKCGRREGGDEFEESNPFPEQRHLISRPM